MSLSDCPKCWETPCMCGYEYRNYTTEDMVKWIEGIIEKRTDKHTIVQTLVKEFAGNT